ncbi:MAG TPA: hypothetical protein VJP80_04675 [Candidatus Saccharimonadales bacterium]|nr:hypothetical protein [Candidatus Saccharimonadales bacterium]
MANKRNLQPLLDVRQNQLDFIFSASDSLDTKALAVLGFDTAIVIFALQSLTTAPLWLLLPVLFLFLPSLIYAVLVIWPQDYRGSSVTPLEHPDYLAMSEDQLVLQLLADTEKAITLNTPLNNKKSRYCIRAILISLAGVILLIPCIIKA